MNKNIVIDEYLKEMFETMKQINKGFSKFELLRESVDEMISEEDVQLEKYQQSQLDFITKMYDLLNIKSAD